MNEKKPDNVVFDSETELYDASLRSYPTSLGSPVIKTVDAAAWKNKNLQVVNAQFSSRYDELIELIDTFKESFDYNQLVYNAKFNFEPIVGKTYHLYKNSKGVDFLSILAPQECGFHFLGSYYLNHDKIWEKV